MAPCQGWRRAGGVGGARSGHAPQPGARRALNCASFAGAAPRGCLATPPPLLPAAPPTQNTVISQDARGAAWRRPFTAFTGAEPPEEYVPAWAASAVLHATFPYVRELKAAFVLQPAEGCGLPSLLQSRLNAPRILQVKKVRRGDVRHAAATITPHHHQPTTIPPLPAGIRLQNQCAGQVCDPSSPLPGPHAPSRAGGQLLRLQAGGAGRAPVNPRRHLGPGEPPAAYGAAAAAG
jgi:hypothetical protein